MSAGRQEEYRKNAALALGYAMVGHHRFPDALTAGVRNFRQHGAADANASPEPRQAARKAFYDRNSGVCQMGSVSA
jgi:hypothetical protein